MQDFEYSENKAVILEQAAEWLLIMDEQPLTQEQQQQFEQWKNLSPLHQKTWQRAEKIRNKLEGHAQNIPKSFAKNVLVQQDHTTPWAGKLVILFASGSVLGFSLYIAQQQAWLADHRTSYAEQNTVRLDDGTLITLNRKTAIDVNYTSTDRQIILRFGEIYVETGKDSAKRPFKVLNQHGEMLALGTAFNVQQEKDQTELIVIEHAVQITTNQSKQKQTIQAGQQIGFGAEQFYPVQQMQLEQLSWRKGLVTVNRMNLKDFSAVIEKNYGLTTQIDSNISSSMLDQIEISGSYPINNLDRMIELLENTYPIRVQQTFFGRKLMITAKN